MNDADPAITLPDPFEDGDLRLRLPTEADIPRVSEICRDPAIGHFTNVPIPYGPDDARAWVELAHDHLQRGLGVHLAVELDGDVAGAVACSLDAGDDTGELRYSVAPGARGRGVATRAAGLLCSWALAPAPAGLGLARIDLDTAASNVASNTVARRLGFTHEGTRRSAILLRSTSGFPERRDDVIEWGLLAGELR